MVLHGPRARALPVPEFGREAEGLLDEGPAVGVPAQHSPRGGTGGLKLLEGGGLRVAYALFLTPSILKYVVHLGELNLDLGLAM